MYPGPETVIFVLWVKETASCHAQEVVLARYAWPSDGRRPRPLKERPNWSARAKSRIGGLRRACAGLAG